MLKVDNLKRISPWLQGGAVLVGIAGLAFRSTLYWTLPAATDTAPGTANLVDFALAMLLFLICALCATTGVGISLLGNRDDKRHAYQAFFVGVLSFIAYDLLHPLMPRLM